MKYCIYDYLDPESFTVGATNKKEAIRLAKTYNKKVGENRAMIKTFHRERVGMHFEDIAEIIEY